MSLPVSNSSAPASYRHPFWHDILRTTCLISTITIIVVHPFRCVISIGSGDGWGQGVHSGRWSDFSDDGVLLVHLLFFIRVANNDDIAIAGRPKKPAVEVIEESLGELLLPRSVGEGIFLLRRKIHHRDPLGRPAMLIHW
jgi:hypothetical protein